MAIGGASDPRHVTGVVPQRGLPCAIHGRRVRKLRLAADGAEAREAPRVPHDTQQAAIVASITGQAAPMDAAALQHRLAEIAVAAGVPVTKVWNKEMVVGHLTETQYRWVREGDRAARVYGT